jgi:ribosomal protein L20
MTSALYTALNILGYQCYHYIETRKNRKHKHIRYWLEVINANVNGIGKAYGRAGFDKVLAKYNVRSWSLGLLRSLRSKLTVFLLGTGCD